MLSCTHSPGIQLLKNPSQIKVRHFQEIQPELFRIFLPFVSWNIQNWLTWFSCWFFLLEHFYSFFILSFVKLSNIWLFRLTCETVHNLKYSWFKILGVYEMRKHTVLPSKLEQFSHRFQQGVEDRNKYSQLIGIWYSDFGELNQGTCFWNLVVIYWKRNGHVDIGD